MVATRGNGNGNGNLIVGAKKEKRKKKKEISNVRGARLGGGIVMSRFKKANRHKVD